MRSKAVMSFLLIIAAIVVLSPLAIAEKDEGFKTVDIDNPLEFEPIEFDHGEKLNIHANIVTSPNPVSILLMKGDDAYQGWLESDDVDVDKIKSGENVTAMNVSVMVVENFTRVNVTQFDEEIDIGDKDTYYLVVALHRNVSMETDDLLSMATQVQYTVEWKIVDKDVPYELLGLAALFFLAGIGFLAAYFYSRKKQQESLDQEDSEPVRPERGGPSRRPVPGDRRRAPPMR